LTSDPAKRLVEAVAERNLLDALSYEVEGPADAPLVIVLHGWGASASHMRGFVARLGARYRVANVDLPGHGNAPAPSTAFDMEAHAKSVSALITSLGGSAHLIGHSNGGRIGLYMASRAPFRSLIRSLTLVSPSGIPRPRGLKYYVKRTMANTLKAPFSILPGAAREFGLDWLRHSLIWRVLGSSDYRSLDGPMRETFVKLVNTYVDGDLAEIRVPTLLFWGDADEAILKAQMDQLVAGIEDIGLVVLKGAGHFGFLDEPETVYAATAHFLDELGGAA
jgi:pimeloyl-ACP methyl ester carboxylesterase